MKWRRLHLSFRIWGCWLAISGGRLSVCLGAEDSRPKQTNSGGAAGGSLASSQRQTKGFEAPGPPPTTAATIERQLWQSRITMPQPGVSNERKDDLLGMIEKIRSIRFARQQKPSEANVPPLPAEPATTAAISEEPYEPNSNDAQEAEAALPYVPVSEPTLKALRKLLERPEKLENPFRLAEILFSSGNRKEAGICYKEALKRKTPASPREAEDRAWMLFQMGNCLRDDDHASAKQMYRRLIAEYPDSPWTDLAKAQAELMDWYLKDEPKMLIKESSLAEPEAGPQAADSPS
jgi:hypothetical protein